MLSKIAGSGGKLKAAGARSHRAKAAASRAGASVDAHLLAPPDAMQLALAGLQPSLPSTALQAAQHASKLQAEMTALRHAADDAAVVSASKLASLQAE